MKSVISNLIKMAVAQAALVLGLASCAQPTEGTELPLVEFGAQQSVMTLEAAAGHVSFNVFSNQQVRLSMIEPADWIGLDKTAFSGDAAVTADYDVNRGFPRQARVLVSAPERGLRDTVIFRQKGVIDPELTLPEATLILAGSSAGSGKASFRTNIEASDLAAEVVYVDGGEDWITDVTVGDGEVGLEYLGNPQSVLRSAAVVLKWTGGWGQTQSVTLNVMQKTTDDKLGDYVEFDAVRDMAGFGRTVTIEDYVIITGYVVSDKEGRNAGDNPMVGNTEMDYTVCDRTIYLESLDGRYGFNILMSTEADNVFQRYDKVELLLRNSQITGRSNPERYDISGFRSSMIVSRQSGTADVIPVKEKYVSELTDEDIYTYVTLKDCEIPVRKGSLTPFNENYTNACNQGRVNKYPRLVRDIRGSEIYMYTNTTCPYRRDGEVLPYGSGDLSGVIVWELYPQFIYGDAADEDSMGDIGAYQIRHMSKDDIAMHATDGFSTILTEYRYINDKDSSAPYAWKPTLGTNGRFWHTCTSKGADNGSTMGAYAATTYNYLGPVGATTGVEPFRNNTSSLSGLGIILGDGTDYLYRDSRFNADGKGYDGSTNSWTHMHWWDPVADKPYAWMVEVSTAAKQPSEVSVVSMQISVQSGRQKTDSSPVFWEAHWATSETAADDEWKHIGNYTIPDYPFWTPQQMWQSPAFKHIDFRLPTEVMGREKVFIRMRPANKKANSALGFADSEIHNDDKGLSGSCMEYFAIRYN